jgi:hypothetical protein
MQGLHELQHLVLYDPLRMRTLERVRALGLPDCWIGAGFVRNLVWDHLHGHAGPPLPQDVDVIWFDPAHPEPERDRALEAALRDADGSVAWSVKNQARMHRRNGDAPYRSALDAMRCWPETATAVAVRLARPGVIDVAAPFGLDDLFGLIVRPTPRFVAEKYAVYLERIRAKGWQAAWPRLTIDTPPPTRESPP